MNFSFLLPLLHVPYDIHHRNYYLLNLIHMVNLDEELFSSYLNQTDLMALVSRGASDSIYSVAENYFENREFNEVVTILNPVVDTTKNSNVFIYLAVSHTQLKRYTEAEIESMETR